MKWGSVKSFFIAALRTSGATARLAKGLKSESMDSDCTSCSVGNGAAAGSGGTGAAAGCAARGAGAFTPAGTGACGTVFMPFAYVEAAANLLTNAALDPFGKIPEFKYCAVAVEALPQAKGD